MSVSRSEDVQRFHRWSRTYEGSLGQVFFFDPVHRRVVRLLAESFDGHQPGTILDIGCGTGRLLRKAALQWPSARLKGVDPAEGMIEMARSLAPSTEFLLGSGESIPLPDASVDAAFSTISFHHWADQAAGVREVARVLRPSGLFCLADISLPRLAAALIPHSRVHTRAEMRRIFEQADLSVVAQRAIRGVTITATVGRKGPSA